jgi:hypothetical protein
LSRLLKYQIEEKLNEQNWEIVQISTSEEWWDDEHWKICSKHNPSDCFYLCFIVDPLYENDGKQKPIISEIKALTVFPENRNDNLHSIASIQLKKGNFNQKLTVFMDAIKRHYTV